MTDRSWRVGHEYRDRGGIKFEDDEVLNWLVTDAGSIANAGGIRFKDPIANASIDPETGKAVPAYFILITRDMSAHHHNPWEDLIDEVSGNINYWGDAKFSERSRHFNQFKGIAVSLKAYCQRDTWAMVVLLRRLLGGAEMTQRQI